MYCCPKYDWNESEPKFKIGTLSCFKSHLNALYQVLELLFNHICPHAIQVAFTQTHLAFSILRNALIVRGCIPDPKCACGVEKENAS